MFLSPGVLHRIREQIREYLFHQTRIALRIEQVSDLPLHFPAGKVRSKVLDRLRHQRTQRRLLKREFLPSDLRQCEQVIDKASHLSSRLRDFFQAAKSLRVQPRAVVLNEGAGISGNVTQRRPQIVSYRIGETLQLNVCLRQLRRAPLQPLIRLAKIRFRQIAFADFRVNHKAIDHAE